ncbi:MAG: gfo/Idh/MocA family oxidoreductase, partial [Bryobacteraceae bacterium]|nr:gfo/Idh/MocA family oxidoreductase [Bryobacteraceae bacterium]
VMTTTMSELTLSRRPRETEPGYTIGTFPKAVQEQFLKEYRAKYPEQRPSADAMRPDREETFEPPRSHNAHLEHHKNFYAAVRSRKLFLEDAVFGMRTAAPALLCNMSVSKQRVYRWDPESMTAKEA